MGKIYLVIVKDRHIDVEIYPFSNREMAIEEAKLVKRKRYVDCGEEELDRGLEESENEKELNKYMYADSWHGLSLNGRMLYLGYFNNEMDCVYVVEKEIDKNILI